MIITRAPLRITLGGGGTDLKSYYEHHGGELIAATINKYIYIALHKTFQKEFIIKYSQQEIVKDVESIQHPIIREALKLHQVEPQFEIVSFADIPDGTGLGSSGAFSVALLRAITHSKRQNVLTQTLAEEACDIEINKLGRSIGKQDQYASAFGGITHFKFNKDESVEVKPLIISSETLHHLEDHLLLFFTGFSRNASNVLHEQKIKTEKLDPQMLENLHFTKELGILSKKALETGNLEEFARLMHVHWENKRKRSDGMSNSIIDHAYEAAIKSGALGGKLIGAGAGGFLMFFTYNHTALREAMTQLGLSEVRFNFDFEGTKVINS